MSSKGTVTELQRAYVKAVYELERVHDGRMRIVVQGSDHKGALLYRAELCDVVEDRLRGVRVQVRDVYPNAANQTLEGFLFKLVVALDNAASKPPPID